MNVHFLSARFEVREESMEGCQSAIRPLVEYERADEPGTLSYISLQGKNPTRFLHLFIFRDKRARNALSNSNAMNRVTSILYPNQVAAS